jgi:hypothetical protein
MHANSREVGLPDVLVPVPTLPVTALIRHYTEVEANSACNRLRFVDLHAVTT